MAEEESVKYLKQIAASMARVAEALETFVELQSPDDEEEEEE